MISSSINKIIDEADIKIKKEIEEIKELSK